MPKRKIRPGGCRGSCREAAWFSPSLPLEALPFEAITPKGIKSASFSPKAVSHETLQNSFEKGGRFNEVEGGAIILAKTKHKRPAKLLAQIKGKNLLIRSFVTYGPDRTRPTRGQTIRLSGGDRLDLDRGRRNPPPGDADVVWERSGPKRALRPVNGTRLRVLDPVIAIPVIAHYMKSRFKLHKGNNVERDFPRATLKKLLAPSSRMNKIWRQAGIFFFLRRIERCSYASQDFGDQPGFAETIYSPNTDCKRFFRRVTKCYDLAFRSRGRKPMSYGLDLYVWWNLQQAEGYGASHRHHGKGAGLGAVWIDVDCLSGSCGRTLAHEAGHFFGLCHTCRAPSDPLQHKFCGHCRNAPKCSAKHRRRLMRGDAKGTLLDPVEEISVAREQALQHRLAGVGVTHQ